MKQCDKCERLVNIQDLKQIEEKSVCKDCQTTKKLN